MGKDEVSTKKRRKINTTTSIDASKLAPADVYKRVVEFEESEAQIRSAEKDAALFKKICHDVRQIFSDVADLKVKGTDEANEKINAKRIEASLLLVALKKLNRLEKVRTRAGRDALHKEKQRVDSTHLLLQNLLYEADHLDKEVTKCLQFKSKDEEIELVPLKDFYRDAPSEISRPEVTKADEHQLQLARLEWELRQRRELAGVCSELVSSKERVAAAIAAARSRLDALAPHLRDVLKATKPLQECLALRLDEKRDEAQAAALLPPPLFLLYANAGAYSDALGAKNVTVAIAGDEDEARRLDQLTNEESEVVVSNDSDSDQDNNDEDHRDSKKKRHHRTVKVSKEERAEAKKKEVLKTHPLNVHVTVKNSDETSVDLIFSYMIHLKIVVVKFIMNVSKPIIGVSAADVLNGDCILNELYVGDTGTDSPHPATAYLLSTAGISEHFSHFISEIGRPFIWAQRMCGLDFMAVVSDKQKTNKNIQPCQSLSVASVENFIFTLKKRLKARVELMKELQDLESGKILPSKGMPCPVKLSGSLTQWQSITWNEYSQAPSTLFLISEGLVTDVFMLYRAIITRQSAKLVALVAVSSDYPKKAPLFSLTLHWNGTHNSLTNDDIRDIERVINTDWHASDKGRCSLSSQIMKLLTCLDILLETMGSPEFPPDKVMLQSVRGRNRMKPYKFLKQGAGAFVHY
ncbi:THO complex subunit 5 homolog [Pararge aegeria]|uniref:Jg9210 protein n=6 Tax=Satyrini TaxID=127320 RepID=A0A8S4SHP0_9NEOP|nr:THO complex subunit 5 homolog [Pararge aegeria]CAH2262836.1 jg9210 [Pararge aegeria aegeria]